MNDSKRLTAASGFRRDSIYWRGNIYWRDKIYRQDGKQFNCLIDYCYSLSRFQLSSISSNFDRLALYMMMFCFNHIMILYNNFVLMMNFKEHCTCIRVQTAENHKIRETKYISLQISFFRPIKHSIRKDALYITHAKTR